MTGLRLIVVWVSIAVLLSVLAVFSELKPSVSGPFALAESAIENPWYVQSGLRIATLREKVPTVDRVVLVPDEATFLAAIGEWSLEGRWPILIEDDRYAPMFVRRFQPAETIRLPAVKTPLPEGNQLRQAMQQAVAKAWNVRDSEFLKGKWQELGWEPPGVAIASASDPAWPAAVALAADRGQPLVFLEGDFGKPNDTLAPEDWWNLKAEVERVVENTGYPYSNLGDAIDTITIVRQMAVKYQSPRRSNEQLSVTDGLARQENGDRWAVVGWIFGSPARAVYQAMCSIFLDPKTAMLYDGYAKSGTWQKYEMNSAARQLRQFGINVQLVQRPEAGLEKWRSLAAREWEFDLIFVNSSGSPETFNVAGGDALVPDIPTLKFPAAMHVIHSWSATTPDNPDTVGGRWLANGAYLYVGSVHEPYLRAFVPPQLIVSRLLNSTPFLIAARHLELAPWKITTIGDPLMVIAKPRQRISPAQRPMKLSVLPY